MTAAGAADVSIVKAQMRGRVRGRPPRVHPFGFIQVDLDAHTRLHVWPDAPLRQVQTASRIHSHSFDGTSLVLTGSVTEILYAGDGPRPTHHAYRPTGVGVIDVGLVPVGGAPWAPTELYQAQHVLGVRYSIAAYHLHVAEPHGLAATLMTITKRYRRHSRVLIPIGEEPLVRHPAAVDPDELWPFIERALA